VLSESSTPKDLAKTISKLVETASPILYSYERIDNNDHSTLTLRQIEILSLAAKGLSNKEIAKHLHLAEGTIKRHFSNIFKVLKVSNRVAAINSSHNTERLK
jgi:DNA-binding NarL/FixJ family response regulator